MNMDTVGVNLGMPSQDLDPVPCGLGRRRSFAGRVLDAVAQPAALERGSSNFAALQDRLDPFPGRVRLLRDFVGEASLELRFEPDKHLDALEASQAEVTVNGGMQGDVLSRSMGAELHQEPPHELECLLLDRRGVKFL